VAILRRTAGRFVLRLRVVRQRRASGRLAHRGEALFHEAKGPASFHSIKGMDNLISIEDRDEPVHRSRSVARAECNVFPKDAPGILHSSQDRLLIRVVHGTRLGGTGHRPAGALCTGFAGMSPN
jgi:hypothetical protein